MKRVWILLTVTLLFASGCFRAETLPAGAPVGALRLGYMANVTHAQALLGLDDGTLERAVGVPIQGRLFPSGPPAVTALLAGEIDALYVGPPPVVNAHVRSSGEAVRVVAGAASGGAVFVVRPGFDPHQLDGARLATPGLANTQDVSAKHHLAKQGLRPRERGGTVSVVTIPPAEILTLFARGDLDGAWVAEPWGSRLVHEAGAQVAWDERSLWPDGQFATTLLVVSAAYLEENPEQVKGLVAGHVAVTRWMAAHPVEARDRLQDVLARLQGRPLPDVVLDHALARVDFVWDPMVASVQEQADRSFSLGYMGPRRPSDLDDLFDLTLLQEVVR